MRVYLDAGFLIVLLFPTSGSATASKLFRGVSGPITLNFLHRLQTENFLFHKSSDEAARRGLRVWRHHLTEGIFEISPVDWESAFRMAVLWNDRAGQKAPPPWLILHPALAAVAEATHFLSFDPRSRSFAKAVGMRLLPENL